MKRLTFLLAFGVSTLKVFSQPNLAVMWIFDNGTTTGGTPNPSFVNPLILLSASPIYVGTGISPTTYFNGPTGGGLNRAKASTNWTPGFNINKYFGATLIPLPINILVIDSVNFWAAKSNVGPTEIQIRSSPSNYSPNGWIGNNIGDVSWRRHSVVVPLGMSPDSIGIRLYTYGTSLTNTTWRIDSLRIYAHLISTLPVELLSFTGKAISQDVELAWTTGSELGNDHFKVMRSDDGQAWTEIGRVPGSGTTNLPRDYGFLDRDPSVGTNYYKLRQVDWDGQYEDSPTISVDVGRRNWFRLVADGIVSDEPTTLFDELGRTLSGPSREHRIARTGIFFLREERSARSERLFLFTEP